MNIPVYVFLPVIGVIIGSIIGHREYKKWNQTHPRSEKK